MPQLSNLPIFRMTAKGDTVYVQSSNTEKAYDKLVRIIGYMPLSAVTIEPWLVSLPEGEKLLEVEVLNPPMPRCL